MSNMVQTQPLGGKLDEFAATLGGKDSCHHNSLNITGVFAMIPFAGSDTKVRMYMLNSGVVRAEPLKFKANLRP